MGHVDLCRLCRVLLPVARRYFDRAESRGLANLKVEGDEGVAGRAHRDRSLGGAYQLERSCCGRGDLDLTKVFFESKDGHGELEGLHRCDPSWEG